LRNWEVRLWRRVTRMGNRALPQISPGEGRFRSLCSAGVPCLQSWSA